MKRESPFRRMINLFNSRRNGKKVCKLQRTAKQVEKESDEFPVTLRNQKENSPSGCKHHLGYLANRPNDAPIAEECLTCLKLMDCMVTTDSKNDE